MQVTVNTRVEAELRQRLDAYAKRTGRPIASIVSDALDKYLSEEASQVKYYECVILRGDDGTYIASVSSKKQDAASNIENDLRNCGTVVEMHELGVDELPYGVEDIRNKINNAPDRVFALRDKWGNWNYAGIKKVQVSSK